MWGLGSIARGYSELYLKKDFKAIPDLGKKACWEQLAMSATKRGQDPRVQNHLVSKVWNNSVPSN